MSIFEALMLLCFGAAWPFSIYKSYHTGNNGGKSLVFLYIVLAGYAAGIIHKLLHSRDPVLVLYLINACMVVADILIFYRNRALGESPADR